jgi:hypothetical protein
MTTREELLKLKRELVAKENQLAQEARIITESKNFAPVQNMQKRPIPKKDVPNVIQHPQSPKRTENKW